MRIEVVIGRKPAKFGARAPHSPYLQVLQHHRGSRFAPIWRGVAVTLEDDPAAVTRPLAVVCKACVVRDLCDFAAGQG